MTSKRSLTLGPGSWGQAGTQAEEREPDGESGQASGWTQAVAGISLPINGDTTAGPAHLPRWARSKQGCVLRSMQRLSHPGAGVLSRHSKAQERIVTLPGVCRATRRQLPSRGSVAAPCVAAGSRGADPAEPLPCSHSLPPSPGSLPTDSARAASGCQGTSCCPSAWHSPHCSWQGPVS